MKVHYAKRIFRSVLHLGQEVWQPLCGLSNTSNITMTTRLREVTCLNCRNSLIRHARRLGLSRQVNKVRREGHWYETDT